MKKVKMIVTNRFDPDVRVFKEAKYLIARGFDIEVLCWDRENEYRDREIEELEGIRIRRFYPYATYGSGIKQLLPFFKFSRECKAYLKDNEADFLHCHDLDGIITGYIARSYAKNIIFDMHELYEVQGRKQKLRYFFRLLVRSLQKRSDYIIYVNEVQTENVRKEDKQKLVFLPNYPDKSHFPISEKTESEQLRISYIGSVRQYNELKKLFEAGKSISGVSIAVHGSGVAYKRLKEIENLYSNVQVTGPYNFVDSPKLYGETDILYAVYPMNTIQNKIAYPIKFFETIITETPIIVSKGSVLEVFLDSHDIGFAVDGSNTAEITQLLTYLNNNRHVLEDKVRELKKIKHKYVWEEVVQNLDKIYIK